MDRKIRKKITNVLTKKFNFFWNRPDPTQKETGPRSARKKYKLSYVGLDSAQPRGLG
jgi:hypothetical protein